jgi:hypothetical protein
MEGHKKFHQFYPKTDLIEKQKQSRSPGRHAVEKVTIDVGGDIKESMDNLHKELMSLDIYCFRGFM